jgi:NADH:ubiquinone oxidoreductase subunit 4 (subunit M)
VGFGVKVPLWPSTSWLLKAHVEASVEFSILLSGYIVKIGVLGLYRTLLIAEAPSLNLLTSALATIGLLDAGSRLPAQRDLKRIVALTTVIEMN